MAAAGACVLTGRRAETSRCCSLRLRRSAHFLDAMMLTSRSQESALLFIASVCGACCSAKCDSPTSCSSVDRGARKCCACIVIVRELADLGQHAFVPHQVTVATDAPAPFTSGHQASASDPKVILLGALAGELAQKSAYPGLLHGLAKCVAQTARH